MLENDHTVPPLEEDEITQTTVRNNFTENKFVQHKYSCKPLKYNSGSLEGYAVLM